MRVITYNIKDGGKDREHLIFEVVASVQPDLILLQEVTHSNRVQDWANKLKMECIVAGGRSVRRVALLSRYPIQSWQSHTPIPGLSRDFLTASIEYQPQHILNVLSIHLTAQPLFLFEWLRILEMRAILHFVAGNPSTPCLAAGDFNAVSTSDTPITQSMPWHIKFMLLLQGNNFQKSVIPMIEAAHFSDCFREMTTELGYTLPPPKPTIRFDYIFANEPLIATLKKCFVVQQPNAVETASDHYPVCAEFAL